MTPVPMGLFHMGTSIRQFDEVIVPLDPALAPKFLATERWQEIKLPRPYFIDCHPVTAGDFYRFAQDLGRQEIERLEMDMPPAPTAEASVLPATGVTWMAAVRYAGYYGKRLPTEAEWEKAAGFDPETHSMRVFPWGDSWDADTPRCNRTGVLKSIYEYGATGQSALGCCDLVGNALEWCADVFEPGYHFRPYSELGIDPRQPPADGERTVRGGSCSRGARDLECRVAWRAGEAAKVPLPFGGFRCVRDVEDRDEP